MWNAEIAGRAPVAYLYVSPHEDALSFPSGVEYAPPMKQTMNLTVLSWVNDTQHPTTSRSTSVVTCVPKFMTRRSSKRPARECLQRERDSNFLHLAACLRPVRRPSNSYGPWKWHFDIRAWY